MQIQYNSHQEFLHASYLIIMVTSLMYILPKYSIKGGVLISWVGHMTLCPYRNYRI